MSLMVVKMMRNHICLIFVFSVKDINNHVVTFMCFENIQSFPLSRCNFLEQVLGVFLSFLTNLHNLFCFSSSFDDLAWESNRQVFVVFKKDLSIWIHWGKGKSLLFILDWRAGIFLLIECELTDVEFFSLAVTKEVFNLKDVADVTSPKSDLRHGV